MRNTRLAWTGMALLIVVGVALVTALLLQYIQRTDTASLQQRVLSVASQLRAPGDDNTSTVATSPSQSALHMRYEIQQSLLAGNTSSEIIKQMVREYGPQVYAVPPLMGIGMLLWLLPVVFLLGLVWFGSRFIPQLRNGGNHGVALPESGTSAEVASPGQDAVAERLREYL